MMMRFIKLLAATAVLSLVLAARVHAQDLVVYPTKGQNSDQQQKDEFECYKWAKQQSGFDPMAAPQATAPPPQQQGRQANVVGGAARGAAIGVVGGAIAGDAGKGAAIGAATGGLLGGMRRNQQRQQQDQAQKQWEQQQAAQYQNNRNNYNRALAVCLEGRGYSVR
jgi:outer membrane lipoprotein SlyB